MVNSSSNIFLLKEFSDSLTIGSFVRLPLPNSNIGQEDKIETLISNFLMKEFERFLKEEFNNLYNKLESKFRITHPNKETKFYFWKFIMDEFKKPSGTFIIGDQFWSWITKDKGLYKRFEDFLPKDHITETKSKTESTTESTTSKEKPDDLPTKLLNNNDEVKGDNSNQDNYSYFSDAVDRLIIELKKKEEEAEKKREGKPLS